MQIRKISNRLCSLCRRDSFVYSLIPSTFLMAYFLGGIIPVPEPDLSEESASVVIEPEADAEAAAPEVVVVEEALSPNSTLQDVLFRYGFSSQDVHQLTEETRSVYNLNRIIAGNQLTIETTPEGSFRSLKYEISDEEFLIASYDGTSYRATREKVEFEERVDRIYGYLADSLYATLLVMGEKDRLVADMVEILQWDIDFTALQRGDWFRVIVEKKFLDGEFIKYGRILALQFHTGGKDFYGFLFVTPDGKANYYDDKGNAVKKAFLRVPFHFNPRISSGFSQSRFHPILKKRRPHPAVDFAAPRGTPVLASASGRVVSAGWNGGLGNSVKIRHANGYTTTYSHLSRILVKSGQAVNQGQSVGRVGSTGLSTGPHLDYRIQDQRGRYLNPRKRIAWPSDKPVDKAYWNEFAATRDNLIDDLSEIPSVAYPSSGLDRAD